jgi:hypothetical protein
MSTGENNVIQGRFICEEHEEYGGLGLRPLAMPNADPLPGMTVAHDLLEHFPGDDGGVEAEFMALGACYFLRHESGWVANKRAGMGFESRDASDDFSGDFMDLYRHVAHENFSLTDPGTELPIECEHTEEMLASIVRKGLALTREELADACDDDSEELHMFCSTQTGERILGWLRRGYRKATERFEGHDAYTLAESVFGEIETRLDNWLKSAEEGTEIEVTIDLDNYSVSIESVMGEGETDYCDECDGTGELDGEDEGNFHDCPEGCAEEGKDDCKGCAGKGYIAPPVKCHCDEGEISLEYRETI